MILMMVNLLIISVLSLAMKFTSKKEESYSEKWCQFECGFNNLSPSHIPFSFQYFLVILLFLVFDIEIAMVLSFPLEQFNSWNSMLMFTFLLLLGSGLLYEWKTSKINWSKWMET